MLYVHNGNISSCVNYNVYKNEQVCDVCILLSCVKYSYTIDLSCKICSATQFLQETCKKLELKCHFFCKNLGNLARYFSLGCFVQVLMGYV